MTGDSTDNGYSAFYDNGGLIVTGTDNLDNYIIEMDFANVIDNGFEILLSFQNEQNFKRIYFISNKTTSRVDRFEFVKNGKEITIIPESRRGFRQVAEGMNHLIIEIRGKTIKLRINNELIYDYSSLPESLAGTMGITTYKYNATPFFDNFALYKLP